MYLCNRKNGLNAKSLRRWAPIALLPLLLEAAPSTGIAAHGWGASEWDSWVEGWGSGAVTGEAPDPCVSAEQCALTVTGTGATQGASHALGQFNLQADLTVDLPGGTDNGFGQLCYPVTGTLTLSPAEHKWDAGSLAVDIQGQDCAVGSNANPSVITATYIVDAANSTGLFSSASGTGTISATLDLSQSPPAAKFAFSGSLQGVDNHENSAR